MPVYLDYAATTPLDPRVRAEMLRYLDDDFGNAGSRTHRRGQRAHAAVERARDRVAAVVGCGRGDVIFTSGATESNNLAILGLASGAGSQRHGNQRHRNQRQNQRHIVSSAIEHSAVLEPIAALRGRGFEVTLVDPEPSGAVDPDRILAAVRPDTLLVSLMQVNNETGVIQPIADVAAGLSDSNACLHVDAAQGYGRELESLQHPRIDLISASAHKIGGPKGVGTLIVRRRNGQRPPLEPLMYGGGQERQLRPGTLPVPLIAGFGLAAELAVTEANQRAERCRAFRRDVLAGLAPLDPVVNASADLAVPYILNLSFAGVDGETVIDAWADLVDVSNGAACTSQSYTCSHVLSAMRLPAWQRDGAVRLSWGAESTAPDWAALVTALEPFRSVVARVGTA